MNFFPLLILTVMNPVESSYTIFGSGAAEWQKALSDYLLLKKVRQGLKEEHVSLSFEDQFLYKWL